jgi:hypothetical protein
MTRGHAQVAVALAIASVLTSGCTDDSNPGTQPLPTVEATATKTATATATATPTPTMAQTPRTAQVSPSGIPPTTTSTPATLPTAATDRKASVEAFIRDYYEATNFAGETGDTSRLLSMTTNTCVCRKSADYFERVFNDGRLEGFRVSVVSATVTLTSPDVATATVVLNISPYKVIRRDGTASRIAGRPRVSELDELVARKGKWLMTNVSKIRPDK